MKRLNRDDIDKFYECDLFLPSRTIYMGSCSSDWSGNDSGVDFVMAERVIKALHILERTPAPVPEITITMNNPGGDVLHGLAIFDAIRECACPVTIRVKGMAMSMGAWILQAADRRILSPHARVMIHYGYQGHSTNHPKIVQKWAEEYKRLDKLHEEVLLSRIHEKHPDFSRRKLQHLMDFDTILTAHEAVDLGLADEVQ